MSAALSFDDVFASHGLFGVEVSPDVAERAGERVTVRGYLYGPLATGPTTFVLGRAVWRACACCQGEPAWPDDVALIELRAPIGSRFFRHGDPEDEVDVTGVEPMTSVIPMKLPMRADDITDGGIEQKILANAPLAEDDFFLVPKVIE